MEHNPDLIVERLEAELLDSDVVEAGAVFDPLLEAFVGKEKVRARDLSSGGVLFDYETEAPVGEALLTQLFPTGTTLEVLAASEVVDASRDGQQLVEARLSATVTQSLMQGASKASNLATVRAARLEAQATRFEVQAFAELQASLVEQSYWDYAAAREQLEIYAGSVRLAEGLLESTRARVEQGLLGSSELVAAKAEIALRRQESIDIQSEMDTARILLLGYMDRPDLMERPELVHLIEDLDTPVTPPESVAVHIAAALENRPELMQARLMLQRGEQEQLSTRSLMKPRLDLFVRFDKTGFGDTAGGAWNAIGGEHREIRAGLAFERFLANREARAEHERAVTTHRQAEEILNSWESLVQVEVRTAHVEAQRAWGKAAAVASTRELDDEKLRIEQERFDLGDASTFQVARAQRDLVRRQADEALAKGEYRKALAELYRVDGSLLSRRGILVESLR
jgi:outer membrane protein TolC